MSRKEKAKQARAEEKQWLDNLDNRTEQTEHEVEALKEEVSNLRFEQKQQKRQLN